LILIMMKIAQRSNVRSMSSEPSPRDRLPRQLAPSQDNSLRHGLKADVDVRRVIKVGRVVTPHEMAL
jgi:hypothetical protein